MDTPRYASMNGHPVRQTLAEAWELVAGAWIQISVTDAANNAALMSEADFAVRFGPLPALPAGAFRTPR
jgi:hypothetical protein